MYNASELRIARQLQDTVEAELFKLGLLCRVFSRAKSEHSIKDKIERSPEKYSNTGKKIQDAFGLRVALYFLDDQEIAIETLKKVFAYDEESSTIDKPSGEIFSATRCNLIFKLPEELSVLSNTIRNNDLIDTTFELQIRTVLSEGWHEVEHDLRYKCKDDWGDHSDLDRALNGIYASLETADWSMLKLLEELAYRHYKSSEWTQMIRAKFRLRSSGALNDDICALLASEPDIGKKLYRVDRSTLMRELAKRRISLPVTPDNIVYLCNFLFIGSEHLSRLTPPPILDVLSDQ